MEEKFIYLLHDSKEMCELTQQRLKEASIESKIEDYNENAFFSIYGGNSILGKKILVPKSKLLKAKQLLNITNNKKDNFSEPKKQGIFRIILRIIALVFLIALLALLIFSFIETTRL